MAAAMEITKTSTTEDKLNVLYKEYFAPAYTIEMYEGDKIYHSNTISTENIKRLLENEFYNPEVMRQVSQAFKDKLYLSPGPTTIPSTLISETFNKRKRIGEASAYGKVIDVDSFVIKTGVTPNNWSLIHEMFIGMMAMNKMRDHCPNFVYTTGGFFCSPSYIVKEKVFTFCTVPTQPSINNGVYIILEKINNSKSLEYHLKNGLTPDDILLILYQCLVALKKADDLYKFTHYDLHTGNVLVVKRPGTVIKCESVNYGTVYLKTNYVPMIIDYGLSRITLDGKDYSLNGIAKFNPNFIPNDFPSFPLYDVVRLFYIVHIHTRLSNPLFSNSILNYMQYFDSDKAHKLARGIVHWSRENLAVTYEMLIRKFEIDFNFGAFFAKNAHRSVIPGPGLSCSYVKCLSAEEIQSQIFIPEEDSIECETIEQFIDQVNKNKLNQIIINKDILKDNLSKIIKLTQEKKETFSAIIEAGKNERLLMSDQSLIDKYLSDIAVCLERCFLIYYRTMIQYFLSQMLGYSIVDLDTYATVLSVRLENMRPYMILLKKLSMRPNVEIITDQIRTFENYLEEIKTKQLETTVFAALDFMSARLQQK